MAWASPPIPPGSGPRSVMLKDPVPVGVQTTGWTCTSGVNDQPATSPDSLIPEATPVSPPSVPRSVMRRDPEPLRVQTTGWVFPSGVMDQPATSPAGLMAVAAALEGTPGS